MFSDTHGGHKQGLLNPETKLAVEVVKRDAEGNVYSEIEYRPAVLNPVQEWLWEVYQDNINKTMELADGDDVMVIHNGDLSQGNKYNPTELEDVGTQFLVASSNMRPWFNHSNVKWFKLIWGTASHIYHDGSTPRLVFDALHREYPNVELSQSKHSLLKFFGITMDIAHHGPGAGGRNWLKGNEARYYTKSLMADSVQYDDVRPPDIVCRSHYHSVVEEYVVEFYKKWGRVRTLFTLTPSYQGLNEFSRQVTRSKPKIVNGHVAYEIINGKLHDVHWFTDFRDARQLEVYR